LQQTHDQLRSSYDEAQLIALHAAERNTDISAENAQLRSDVVQMTSVHRRIARLAVSASPLVDVLQALLKECMLHTDVSPAGDASGVTAVTQTSTTNTVVGPPPAQPQIPASQTPHGIAGGGVDEDVSSNHSDDHDEDGPP